MDIEELKRALESFLSSEALRSMSGRCRFIKNASQLDPLIKIADVNTPSLPIRGDEIGDKSGLYFFVCPEGEVLYIGKATKNNLHERVWDHLRTPVISQGMRTFPQCTFKCPSSSQDAVALVQEGAVRLAIIHIDPPEIVSLCEVYLQTIYQLGLGRLPKLNKQIG
jgi:hypothetical protein